MGRSSLFCFLCVFAVTAWGQTNRYVVFHKDKAGSSYTVDHPEQFLSPRALVRRDRNQVSITEKDLPVSSNYTNQLQATGAKVFFSTRWMNATLVQCTPAEAAVINELPFVQSVQYVAPGAKLSGGRTQHSKNKRSTGAAAATALQLSQLGMDQMHADELHGEGVLVAVFDSGFQGVDTATPFTHLFTNQQIEDQYDFIGNSTSVYRYDDHGTEVFSIMAASSENFTGGATGSTYLLYVTEDVTSEYRIEEFNWLFAAERADSIGADIIQSSLGYNLFDDEAMDYSKQDLDGVTAVISRAAAMALERGMLVVVSAGNEGSNTWQLVTPPADVDGVLAVGAVTSSSTKSSFSSVGPTADQRIKPDVVALGTGTSVVRPSGAIGSVNGTSAASPLVASLAAGILQRFPDLSVQDLYRLMTTTATQANQPNNLLGYGIPGYPAVVNDLHPPLSADEISIYPNPVQGGKINVWIRQNGQTARLIVRETLGRVLQDQTLTITWRNNPVEVDLSSLPSGVYLVEVIISAATRLERIVKK